MKKSLISMFALAFALMFGMVHVASAQKHMAPAAGAEAAPAADGKMDEKKDMKKEKKKAKKKAMKKEEKKEGAATPATPATPAAPAK